MNARATGRPKQRLGRGLGALLGDAPGAAGDSKREVVRELALDVLQRGRYQPRTKMDEASLQELAQSVKAQGVLQPILVRPVAAGYEIIAGERRWRAAQRAGLVTVPVIIRDIADEAAVAVALIENIQREDLSPLEEARALKRLMGEFKLTHQQTAEAIGRSRATVTNQLRLLSLAPVAYKLLENGEINAGHARALLSLATQQQDQLARTIVRKTLTVRDTELLVRNLATSEEKHDQPPATGNASKGDADPDIAHLQGELSEKLQARVIIRHGAKKGQLIIEYHSLDELDGIIAHIQ